jgi:Xaa-Pro aminopeptidase
MDSEKKSLRIPDQEHRERLGVLTQEMEARNASGCVLFERDYILYYSGFAFIPTERPIALLANVAGRSALYVPRLELEHAQANAVVDDVFHYPEYPGEEHPMSLLAEPLEALGLKGRLGADEDGYPWILGYRGPSLTEVCEASVLPLREFIESQMSVKSPRELSLIEESVRWGNLAHQLLQRYTAVGRTETDASQRAGEEATRAMLDAIGPLYRAQSPFGGGARAGYRGQIGRSSAIPHALAANLTFQPGDVLVTGAGAPVWGYNSELERTMILGEPSKRQQGFFEHMLALQETAFEAMGPGVLCCEVDRAVRAYYQEYDLLAYWKHHTGHAIGLRYHEGPFLDVGDETVMQPGMVFTVEPGLYVPNLGGFRHSDTVRIIEGGLEVLTYYPRDIESLTLPLTPND